MSRSKTASRTPRTSRWAMHPLAEAFRRQQGLPAALPAPARETQRIDRGAVTHAEFARWIVNFLDETPSHPQAAELRAVADRFVAFQHAADAMNDGDLGEAERLFRDVLARHSADELARLNLATVLERLGKAEEAFELAAGLDAVFPDHPRLVVLRARCMQRLGRRDDAIALLRAAHMKNRNAVAIVRELQALGDLVPVVFDAQDIRRTQYVARDKYRELVMTEANRRAKAGDWAGVARIAKFQLEDGKVGEAIAAADLALKGLADDAELLTTKGLALLKMGERDLATETLKKAVAAAPKDAKATLALGRAEFANERKDRAEELFLKAFELDNELVNAAELWILCREGDDKRLEAALELGRKFPTSWVPTKLVGDLEFGQGLVKDALEKHLHVWASSRSDDALTMVIHEYDRLDKTAEAMALIESVADLATRSAAARWNAANVCLKGGRIPKAVEILSQMVRDQSLPHETRFSACTLLSDVLQNTSAGRPRPQPRPAQRRRR